MSALENTGETARRSRLPAGSWRLGLLKLVVSATLVALLVRRFSYRELEAQFLRTDAVALLLPFAIILMSNLLGAVQWGWILRSTGHLVSAARVLGLYFTGLFFNNFMLGSMGGDVYKIYSLGKNGELGRVAGATVVDRIVGLAALCSLALVAALVALHAGRVPAKLALFILVFGVGTVGCIAVILNEGLGAAVTRRLEALRMGGAGPRLARLLGHLRDFRARVHVLKGAFLLSVLIQASRVVAHYFVGLAMGWQLQPADLAKFFLVIPILGLLISLPVSIGGWGVREWAGVALFAPMGHGGQDAVTLLALTASLNLVASLVGAGVLVARALPRRSPTSLTTLSSLP